MILACISAAVFPITIGPAPAAPARLASRYRIADVPFWSQAERDRRFRMMQSLFPTRAVQAGGRSRVLPRGASLPGGGALAITLMRQLHLAGLLVLKDGRVRLERYAPDHSAGERWPSFSVAKSITSTLVGAAIRDGRIRSLEDPVERYVPELTGSAYDGVTVRQLMAMTSGVRWNEDYRDPQSDVIRLFTERPGGTGDATVAYMRGLPRAAAPGTQWHYSTGDAELLGVVVRRALSMPLARYLSLKLWRPFGMGRNAAWQVDRAGHEYGSCCLLATLGDYARFGQFMLDQGRIGPAATLPAGWIDQATRTGGQVDHGRGYGLGWWTNPNGSYSALGIFGQMIHVDPRRHLVIAMIANWPDATDQNLSSLRLKVIDRIRRAIDQSS